MVAKVVLCLHILSMTSARVQVSFYWPKLPLPLQWPPSSPEVSMLDLLFHLSASSIWNAWGSHMKHFISLYTLKLYNCAVQNEIIRLLTCREGLCKVRIDHKGRNGSETDLLFSCKLCNLLGQISCRKWHNGGWGVAAFGMFENLSMEPSFLLQIYVSGTPLPRLTFGIFLDSLALSSTAFSSAWISRLQNKLESKILPMWFLFIKYQKWL